MAAAGLVFVAPWAGLLAAVGLVVTSTIIDGAIATAAALAAGWTVTMGAAMAVSWVSSLDPPPGAQPMTGMALFVLQGLVVAFVVGTAIACAVARLVRRWTANRVTPTP